MATVACENHTRDLAYSRRQKKYYSCDCGKGRRSNGDGDVMARHLKMQHGYTHTDAVALLKRMKPGETIELR